MIHDVADYISHHITENIKTTDIAAYLGRNRVRLTTDFKKHSGMNLSDFIRWKKIQKAEELLQFTDKSVLVISDYLGFSSQSHFCKVFKEMHGMTPTAYRKKRAFVTNLSYLQQS